MSYLNEQKNKKEKKERELREKARPIQTGAKVVGPVKAVQHGIEGAKKGDIGQATYGGFVEGLPGGSAVNKQVGKSVEKLKSGIQTETRTTAGDIIFRGSAATVGEAAMKAKAKIEEHAKAAKEWAIKTGKKVEDWAKLGGGTDKDFTGIPMVAGPGGGGGMGGGSTAFGLPSNSADFGANQEFRNNQAQLIAQLQAQSMGQGPSLAGEQLKQSQAANQAATFAQLASARGGANPGMARQAMQTSAQIQGQTARDAALARIQEQMGARDQLGAVTGAARQGDINEAGQKIQLADASTALQQKYAALDLQARQGDQDAALQIARMQLNIPEPQNNGEMAMGTFQKMLAAYTNRG